MNKFSNITFLLLPLVHDEDHRVDLLWEMAIKFHVQIPNWQGMMHPLNSKRSHPGQLTVMFLPIIGLNIFIL